MGWKKFAGPATLAGIAILLLLAINVIGNTEYGEGDTVDPEFIQTSCCMGLLSILSCLSSIVWFSFALGIRSEKTVFLAGGPGDSRDDSVSANSDSQSDVLPSTIGGGTLSYVRNKIDIEKSEADKAQLVGFLLIFGSIAMFGLMVLLGFISILMSLGPGLGFSGGTCNDTCESLWSGAVLSKWISFSLFPCGLIALARPWSWFRSADDVRNAAVGTIAVVAVGIALIAVISYGGPALIVLLIAGTACLIYYALEDVDLKALKLEEANDLVRAISPPLVLVVIVVLFFEFGYDVFSAYSGYALRASILLAVLVLLITIAFVPLAVCAILGPLVMILSRLNLVGIDGDWGALDLMKSVYSDVTDIFSDEDGSPE